MRRGETSEDVQHWFEGAIAKLWPVAEGSFSLRHCPCIRKNCPACARREGHSSYVLYARKGKRRTSIYVPTELAPKLASAIKNGRRLQQLINEAGVRYTGALKRERLRKMTEGSGSKT
jgi:hypothetical protein